MAVKLTTRWLHVSSSGPAPPGPALTVTAGDESALWHFCKTGIGVKGLQPALASVGLGPKAEEAVASLALELRIGPTVHSPGPS